MPGTPFTPSGHPAFRICCAGRPGSRSDISGLSQVRKGPSNLAEKIEASPARLLSLDAVLQSDLEIIASACRLMPGRVLACGSVGLADELGPLSQGGEGVRATGRLRGRS